MTRVHLVRLSIFALIALLRHSFGLAAETPPTAPVVGAPSKQLAKGRDCSASMKVSTTLNGVGLIEAASSCFREDKQLEGTFLLLAGQIRSSTDLALLRPVDDADE